MGKDSATFWLSVVTSLVSVVLLAYTVLLWVWGYDRYVMMFMGLTLMSGGIAVYLYRVAFIDETMEENPRAIPSGGARDR